MDKSEIIPSKSKDELFMRQVYLNADFSKDPRTKIGAVLTLEDKIVSTGFNGFPRKVVDYKFRYENRETKYNFICHAESNSVTTAARFGRATLGTTFYTQGIPCQDCCKTVIQAGIARIIVHKQWPDLIYSEKWVKGIEISKIMMDEAGVGLSYLDCVLGVQGTLDGKIINV